MSSRYNHPEFNDYHSTKLSKKLAEREKLILEKIYSNQPKVQYVPPQEMDIQPIEQKLEQEAHDNLQGGLMRAYDEKGKEIDCKCDSIPDRIYIETIVPNNTSSTQPAIFSPSKQFSNFNLIDKAEEWVIVPLNMIVPCQAIPLTQIGRPNTTGAYGACISYNSLNFTGQLTAVNDDNLEVAQGINIGTINNYQTIADTYNNTLLSIHNTMLSTTAATGYTSSSVPFSPFITYNPTTYEYSLNAPDFYQNVITGSPQLFTNWRAFEPFQNFQYKYNGRNNSNFKDYQYQIKRNGDGNHRLIEPPLNFGSSATGCVMPQMYPALYNWNIFKNISITSSNIPVDPYNINNLDNSIPYTQNVIMDFPVDTILGWDTRGFIKFNIDSEFQRIDLRGSKAMRDFSYTINWVDNSQGFNILQIPPGLTSSATWMLERKTITRSQHQCKEK